MEKDSKFLLLTDANSALNDPDFAKFMTEVGLFDIMVQMHGMGGINNHTNGTRRIVFALGTYMLTRAVVRSGMLLFHKIITSDHRAMILDINADQIFKGEVHAIYNNAQKKISTSFPKI
eukprot:14962096-Ditylum_brightwellii.AAC.1